MTKEALQQFVTDHKITMEAVFIPWSRSRNYKPDDKYIGNRTLNWSITILADNKKLITVDYQAGIAHCPSYESSLAFGKLSIDAANQLIYETEHGLNKFKKPILPNLLDVLSSLALDSSVLDHSTFEDWACEFGYDTDSRKTEKIYQDCLKEALALRNGLGEAGLSALQRASQEY